MYGWLQHTSLTATLGYHILPSGGETIWILTYPIDVVKTREQVQARERNTVKDIHMLT